MPGFKLDYEGFLEKYEEELYARYMETGSYYDTEREDFDEGEYEEYMQNRGGWLNIS